MAKINIKKTLYPPSLFLEMEGTNGSIFVKDSSKNNYSSTTYGSPAPALNTSVKKNGNSSLFFPGTGANFVGVNPNNNDLRLGTENFTLEFSCYFGSDVAPNNQKALLISNAFNIYDSGGIFFIRITADRKIEWFLKNTFTRVINNILSINMWHEIALIRKDAELFLYINGIQMDSYNIGKNASLNCTSNYIIGLGSEFVGENLYKGYLDDIKITKNFIKYPQIPPIILNIKKITNPSNISNLGLWLKADAGVTYDGSNNVSAWADQSATGNTPTLDSIGTGSPQYKANAINGKPCVFFNNTKSFIKENVNFSDWTVIHVSKLYNDPDGVGRIFSNRGAPNNILVGAWDNKDNRMYVGNQWIFEGTNTNYTWKLSIGTCSTTQNQSFFYQNGQQLAGPVSASQILNGFAIGGGWRDDYPERAICDIAEVIIYNRVLSENERQQIESYLNQKYALGLGIVGANSKSGSKLNIKKITLPPFPIDGLFAFWKLNETSGTRYDSSGNGRNLTETYGTVLSTTGKIGNCAYFNGINGGGSTNSKLGSTSFGINPNSDFSFSVWMKPRSFSGYQHIIGAPFQNGFSIGANGPQYGSTVGYNLTFNLFNGTVWGISAPTTAFDTWHHYVFIRDGNTLKLYADNVYIGSASVAGQSFGGANVFSVGGGEYNEYYFNGDIDAMGIWTKVLTETEISALYNAGYGIEL